MHNAPRRSCFSQDMHSKCRGDSVTMTTASSASEPRLGPARHSVSRRRRARPKALDSGAKVKVTR